MARFHRHRPGLNENGTTYVIHREKKKNAPSPARIAWLTGNSWPVRHKRERERERERDDVTPFGVHVNRLWVNPRVKAAGYHSGAERLKRAAPRDPLVSSLTGKLNHVASGVAASSVLRYTPVENAYGKRKRIVASIKDRPREPWQLKFHFNAWRRTDGWMDGWMDGRGNVSWILDREGPLITRDRN